MKMRRLGCLLYRELHLAKNSLIVNGVMAIFVMLLGIVIPLSSKYGNLTLIPESDKKMMDDIIFMFTTFLPVYAFVGLATSVMETWKFECERKWRLFRKTTPVRAIEYVFVKYILLFAATGLAVPFSAFYVWMTGRITGEGFNRHGMAFVFAMVFLFLSFVQVWQVFILLLGTIDRAAIVMCVMFGGLAFVIMEIVERNEILIPIGDDFTLHSGLAQASSFLPYLGFGFVVVTVVSFFLTVKLYERREK